MCETEKIYARKNTPERKARLKETDLSSIQWWAEKFEILKVPHANALTLDTTHSRPEQTAHRILKHIKETCGSRLGAVETQLIID